MRRNSIGNLSIRKQQLYIAQNRSNPSRASLVLCLAIDQHPCDFQVKKQYHGQQPNAYEERKIRLHLVGEIFDVNRCYPLPNIEK